MSQFEFHRRGLLFVISAPSGGGKSVVVKRLLESNPDLSYSVSVTSRPIRPGEAEGQDYSFVEREHFERMIREDAFYEWAEVHGNFYGTREDSVRQALDRGQDLILDIDVQGGMSVKWRSPEAVLLFLMPPSLEVLEQRLRGRGTDADSQIRLRLENARRETDYWRFYDYVVVNDHLDQTVAAANHILHAERARARRLRLCQLQDR